jgi:hypothetical protein
MFSIQQLSEKIAEISAERLDVEDFEEWLVAESWGHYDIRGDQVSRAIAAIHHVLHCCENGDVEECKIANELANAIRPFELLARTAVRDIFLLKKISGVDQADEGMTWDIRKPQMAASAASSAGAFITRSLGVLEASV